MTISPTWDVLLADHTFLIPGTSTPTAASGNPPCPLAVSGATDSRSPGG